MNEETTPADLTSVAVAIGRVEAVVNGVKESVDRLEQGQKEQATTLADHGVRISLLESHQAPRRSWVEIAGGVVSILTGIGLIGGIIVMLTSIAPALAHLQ